MADSKTQFVQLNYRACRTIVDWMMTTSHGIHLPYAIPGFLLVEDRQASNFLLQAYLMLRILGQLQLTHGSALGTTVHHYFKVNNLCMHDNMS